MKGYPHVRNLILTKTKSCDDIRRRSGTFCYGPCCGREIGEALRTYRGNSDYFKDYISGILHDDTEEIGGVHAGTGSRRTSPPCPLPQAANQTAGLFRRDVDAVDVDQER